MKRKDFKRNSFKTRFFSSLYNVLDWISICFPDRVPEAKLFRPCLGKLDRILHSRGVLFLISYNKKLRNAYLNYLSGNKEKIPGIGLTKDGIPIFLGDLISHLRQVDPRVRKDKDENPYRSAMHRGLMTILMATRSLKAGKHFDVSSITSPCTRELGDFTKHIKSF